ncbi:hypothetical protein V5O48_017578 [Marasmius crinis-equi]|uniref:Uncharacterized protein n=1 Tax=Marasmius crinis-equi TaxID=585013 RepID=A0ABR3ENK4_9AGAR
MRILHGMPCIKYPLLNSLFYWSLDRKGTHRISEADWEKYGIPKLRVETWIGSFWCREDYQGVEECFQLKGYPLDGWRYTRDHNYPEMTEGKFVEYEQSETGSDEEAESDWEAVSDEETESNWETKSDESSSGAGPIIDPPKHSLMAQGTLDSPESVTLPKD